MYIIHANSWWTEESYWRVGLCPCKRLTVYQLWNFNIWNFCNILWFGNTQYDHVRKVSKQQSGFYFLYFAVRCILCTSCRLNWFNQSVAMFCTTTDYYCYQTTLIHPFFIYVSACKLMAKQKVALECLSYHATASQEQTQSLVTAPLKPAEDYKLFSFKFVGEFSSSCCSLKCIN